MKKIMFILSTLVAYGAFILADTSCASPIRSELVKIRKELGLSLNETVNLLKDQIRPQDELIKSEKTELKDLYDTATHIKDRVVAGEVNPTILEHGRVTLKKCGSAEEMYWTGSNWSCKSLNADINCEPTNGEEIDSNGICFQPGAYNAEVQGWKDCNNNKGERYTATGCMFENTKNNTKIQVADSDCSNFKIYEQACGVNGAKSTCKCPAGSEYYYGPDASGNIIEACKTAPESYLNGTKKYTVGFGTDQFTKLRLVPAYEGGSTYLYVILEGQDPGHSTDGRCNVSNLSVATLRSFGFNGGMGYKGREGYPVKGAYKIIGKEKIADYEKPLTLDNFTYTFWSKGSGCSNVSGTGIGNQTFGTAISPNLHGRLYSPTSLTHCAANGGQCNITVSVTLTGVYGYAGPVNYEPLPVCDKQ
jgi:hypothetical protein